MNKPTTLTQTNKTPPRVPFSLPEMTRLQQWKLTRQEPNSNPNARLLCNARTGLLLANRAIGARLRERDTREWDIGERDIGERDIGERDIGERDIGERDIGERDIGERDNGERDIGERDIRERDIGERDIQERDIRERDIGETVATCLFVE